jgi:glycosyltransferase involved in cell wall biosynthesis
MKVLYLQSGNALYGGVKVALQHAMGLRALGVDARILSPDPPPDWFDGAEEVCLRCEPAVERLPAADVAVGTFWFTVPVALAVPGARAFHLCQCYEGLYEGVREEWPAIEAVYRLPTTKLAVSPHLVTLLEQRFGQRVHWIPQPLESGEFQPRREPRPDDGMFRVLVAGLWDVDVKGVAWALDALRPLVQEHPPLRLVRLSLDAPPAEVASWPEAERHLHLPPSAVPDVFRGVDAYVGASTEIEGFGLPALEAMSCGLPSVLTDIGAVRALDAAARASLRVSHGDAAGLRAALRRLRDDADLRARLGAAGREIALQFSVERSARTLLSVFEAALLGPSHYPPSRKIVSWGSGESPSGGSLL